MQGKETQEVALLIRKPLDSFNSIENVFERLLPYLKYPIITLPHYSSGIIDRLKNRLFLNKLRYELVHITGYDHYLLTVRSNKKTILTIHDIEFYNRATGIKKKILKLLWFDLPIKNANYITTISEFTKKELKKIGDFRTPIRVIPNPLTLEIEYRSKSFNSDSPTILQIGTKKNKNLERLVESIKGLKCKLRIIGKLTQRQIEVLKEANVNYSCVSNLSNQEVIEEYYNCDLVSFISTYEGFGLPIIEAQAAGRCVLTSNIASMPEAGGEGALYINPFNIEEIRNGLKKIIESDELRNRLIHKGLENVKKFAPEKIAEQYLKLYKEIK